MAGRIFRELAWKHPEKVEITDNLLDASGGNTLLASILIRRGLNDPVSIRAFLDPDEYTPSRPEDFPGMDAAVNRILIAVKKQERVLVWGDFDVDGQTSTTILVSAFRKLGLNVSYHIPLRESEGHGIHQSTMESLLGGIDLMVTCDTGISAVEEIHAAISRGVEVIVTDHHELPEVLPKGAVALINPHFLPEGNGMAYLAGCGVAYKLAQALFTKSGLSESCRELLDLVALGLVADVAELNGDARFLLQRGLQVLRENRRLGLAYLYQMMDLNPSRLIESDIGFQIGPRLNALGRLGDANKAVEFFTTTDAAQASYLAQELDGLNSRRKLLTDQVLQAALQQLEQNRGWMEDPILVLSHPGWVGGVLGIVASHLVERFVKPVIMLREGEDGNASGSARSVDGVNIIQAIAAQAKILHKFGGHSMAAGLSLPVEMIPEFRQMINHTIRKSHPSEAQPTSLVIEGTITLSEIFGDTRRKKSEEYKLLEELEHLAPYGRGNPAPVFSIEKVHVSELLPIGATGDHRAVTVQDSQGKSGRVVWWQGGDQLVPDGWFNLACTVRMSDFGGKRQPQLEWVDAQIIPEEAQQALPVLQIQFIDLRESPDPNEELKRIRLANQAIQVWAEGPARKEISGKDRTELVRDDELAIWTTPPGMDEIKKVMQIVQPRKVYLLCMDPRMDQPESFLTWLKSILAGPTFLLHQPVHLESLAAATAQRLVTLDSGLRLLSSRGDIHIKLLDRDGLRYEIRSGTAGGNSEELFKRLKYSLSESAAYRRSTRYQTIEQWRKEFTIKVDNKD